MLLNAAGLEAPTSDAWTDYMQSAIARVEARVAPGRTFLWMDEAPDRLAKVRSGQIVVSGVGEQNPKRVPDGLIHDWIGAVFIPNAKLTDVLGVTRDYPKYKELFRPAVVDSKALDSSINAAGETKDRYSMRLINKSIFLKTAFDIDFESRIVQMDASRGYALSWSTRIQQIEEYGESGQHMLPEGQGDGIIWHLFSTTRFAERDGGVYLEIEVIGLSRDIPASIRWLAEPIARRVSRSTLTTSLRQTESAVHQRIQVAALQAKGHALVASARDLPASASKIP
jgi:hypothetical protein